MFGCVVFGTIGHHLGIVRFRFARAFAAAFDAFVAISLRRAGLSFLALASPPLRPISASSCEI
jgi:hypothetical protein